MGLKFELKWLGIGVGAFLGIIGLVLVTGYEPPPPEKQNKINYDNLSEEELQSMTVSWEFDDILRNPEKYENKIISFSGNVSASYESSYGGYQIQVEEHCKPWPDSYDCDFFIVSYVGERALEGDEVRVYGIVDDVRDLKMVLGGSEPTPIIEGIRVICTDC